MQSYNPFKRERRDPPLFKSSDILNELDRISCVPSSCLAPWIQGEERDRSPALLIHAFHLLCQSPHQPPSPHPRLSQPPEVGMRQPNGPPFVYTYCIDISGPLEVTASMQ